MNMKFSRLFKAGVILVIGVATLLGAMAYFGGFSVAQSASPEPWPSFTMTYRDWDSTHGPNQTSGYVRVHLIYRNSRDWESVILEDTAKPEYAGTLHRFVGCYPIGCSDVRKGING